jgi:hypothetical protein
MGNETIHSFIRFGIPGEQESQAAAGLAKPGQSHESPEASAAPPALALAPNLALPSVPWKLSCQERLSAEALPKTPSECV